jgi:ankyrin
VDGYLAGLVLTDAVETNNLARLQFFLEAGASIETPLGINTAGEVLRPTPLMAAAYFDYVSMARFLLEQGAKIEHPSWFSPMHAARSGEMVQLLLDFHADPESVGHDPRRPLHFYANGGNIAAMRVLLQHGVEVDPVAGLKLPRQHELRCQWTPLYEAVLGGSVDSARILLELGADVKRKDGRLDTLFHCAARTGSAEMVRLLVEYWPDGIREKNKTSSNARRHRDDTPLHGAARAGHTEVVRLLLELWPKGLRERNHNWDTPLHVAAESGKTEVVELLMERWPEGIKDKNKALDTPLHLASEGGMLRVVKLLVDRWPEGAKAKNQNLHTPLHRVAQGRSRIYSGQPGTLGVAKLLVECWPESIGERDDNLETPLHIAARAGEYEMAQLFVDSWPEGMAGKPQITSH